jgi:hypothetical protein
MSTGLECEFFQWEEENNWYYLLEQSSAPKCSWDWHEYADAYGPFKSFELAKAHLDNNHANPGGFSTYHGVVKDEPVIAEKIEAAKKRKSASLHNRPFHSQFRYRF